MKKKKKKKETLSRKNSIRKFQVQTTELRSASSSSSSSSSLGCWRASTASSLLSRFMTRYASHSQKRRRSRRRQSEERAVAPPAGGPQEEQFQSTQEVLCILVHFSYFVLFRQNLTLMRWTPERTMMTLNDVATECLWLHIQVRCESVLKLTSSSWTQLQKMINSILFSFRIKARSPSATCDLTQKQKSQENSDESEVSKRPRQ